MEIEMDDQAENAVVDTVDDTEEVQTEAVETEETTLDAAGEAADGEVEDEPEQTFEEIEFEGKKYAVPPELRSAFMQHADYTRKTQEVADNRKALEAEQQQFQQANERHQANLQAYGHVAALDAQLEQYKNVDWQKFSADDPIQAQQAFFQFQQLKDSRQTLAGQISQQERQTLQAQQQQAAQQLEQGRATLAKEIPNWSQELSQTLAKSGAENYGFSDQEMQSIADPRMVRVLHDAHQYRQIMAKATQKPEGAKPAPVRRVRGKSPAKVDMDKLGIDDWMAARNKQVAG